MQPLHPLPTLPIPSRDILPPTAAHPLPTLPIPSRDILPPTAATLRGER
jgi:hypothetical protein